MDVLILPGFSPKNKTWAQAVQKDLNPFSPTTYVAWSHWETGKAEDQWAEDEAGKINTNSQGKQLNIIAKSLGTLVTMIILKSKPELINKIILCGIPITDLRKDDEKYYEQLAIFPSDKLLCIQNIDDNHGSYIAVEKFLHSLNPDIKMISTPRANHEYPYSKLFLDFLNKKGDLIKCCLHPILSPSTTPY